MADANVPIDPDLEERLKQEAAQRGVTYDRSDAEDLAHRDNSPEAFQMELRKYDERASNVPNQDGGSNGPSTPSQAWNAAPASQDPRASDFYNELVARSHQSLAVDPNDPVLRAQVDPYRAEQTRASRNYLSDLAERLGPDANLRGEQRMAAEKVGQNVSGFQGELMARELAARRDEIAQALTLRAGVLSNDQEAALRRELAQLDAQLRRESMDIQRQGLSQNNDQFLRELALRQWQVGDNSALNWASL